MLQTLSHASIDDVDKRALAVCNIVVKRLRDIWVFGGNCMIASQVGVLLIKKRSEIKFQFAGSLYPENQCGGSCSVFMVCEPDAGQIEDNK